MTARSAARPLAALAALAIIVAACGTGTGTQAPATGAATQAPATQAPATTTPTEGAAASGALPSFDLSSFHADQKLEDLFPKEIGGETLTVLSMSGDAFMGEGASPELDAALSALGKSASDLSVAFGGTSGGSSTITIIAFKVAGVPGSTIFTALFNAYQQINDATITDVTISGKSVKKTVPTDDSGTSYLYTAQDVVFAVGGDGITDAQLSEIFSKLP